MAMRQTWMDNSADAADLDLLTAPIVPVGGSGGKKGKRSRDDGGAPPAPVAKESASAKEEDGGVNEPEVAPQAPGDHVRYHDDCGVVISKNAGLRDFIYLGHVSLL